MCSPFRSSGFENPSSRTAAAIPIDHFHHRCRRGRARRSGNLRAPEQAAGQHTEMAAALVRCSAPQRLKCNWFNSKPVPPQAFGRVFTSERPIRVRLVNLVQAKSCACSSFTASSRSRIVRFGRLLRIQLAGEPRLSLRARSSLQTSRATTHLRDRNHSQYHGYDICCDFCSTFSLCWR